MTCTLLKYSTQSINIQNAGDRGTGTHSAKETT